MKTQAIGAIDIASVAAFVPRRRSSLAGRRTDFWLMGGASLVVWALIVGFTTLAPNSEVIRGFVTIGFVASLLSLLLFQPHFIFTYRMAYGRGWRFTAQNWPQLLALPLLLVFVYLGAYLAYEIPVADGFFRSNIPESSSMTYGQLILSLVLSGMFLILGWHHAKQTFGCLMAYRKFDNYTVTAGQRKFLLAAIYALWAVNVVVARAADQLPQLYGLPLFSLTFLEPIRSLIIVTAWSLVLASLGNLIWVNWRKSRQLPSANFLIPIVAILVWWAPPFYQREFYMQFSTIFHALQYWPFALAYEARSQQGRAQPRRLSRYVVGAVALGLLTIFIPMAADVWIHPEFIGDRALNIGFFLIAVQTSLNIHHYFLDSVIWKFDQPQVRDAIFGKSVGT